ncbi:MAG TPA: hypothetical protein VE861_14215 [Gemmatimonadaceae bacterium]|nr:hypothetical protein [Gemmatimonadaceae bacterium]
MTTPAAPLRTTSVLLFDRSDRLRMQFTGPKAAESLTGLVTNDVLGVRGGMGQYACALTPKGRIIADVRIMAMVGEDGTVESLLADTNAAAGIGFAAMIRKYVNPRTAKYTDVTSATSCFTLVGSGAADLLRALVTVPETVDALVASPALTHREVLIGGIAARLVRAPDLGDVDAFDVHLASEHADALRETLVAAGVTSGDGEAWHRLRVLAGRPEWGVDMDEGTLAQEANMDALHAISYNKGCYTGQETVARVHFRGHVNRTLRRVEYPGAMSPAIGTPLLSDDGTAVGDARSSARADDGSHVGIAMLRREVGDGASLTWNAADGTAQVARVTGVAVS